MADSIGPMDSVAPVPALRSRAVDPAPDPPHTSAALHAATDEPAAARPQCIAEAAAPARPQFENGEVGGAVLDASAVSDGHATLDRRAVLDGSAVSDGSALLDRRWARLGRASQAAAIRRRRVALGAVAAMLMVALTLVGYPTYREPVRVDIARSDLRVAAEGLRVAAEPASPVSGSGGMNGSGGFGGLTHVSLDSAPPVQPDATRGTAATVAAPNPAPPLQAEGQRIGADSGPASTEPSSTESSTQASTKALGIVIGADVDAVSEQRSADRAEHRAEPRGERRGAPSAPAPTVCTDAVLALGLCGPPSPANQE